MKRLDEITIADLMPDSISRDAQVSATSRAIDPQLGLISEAVDRPLILPAIDDLSAGVLEHLAVQYDVTAWDSAWPIETKRTVLKTAIADKRKKGTRGAVERAIEAVAPIATLTEWWQDPSGEMLPHTFKIELWQDGGAVGPGTQNNVIAQVDDAKPVRSHYTFTAIQKAGSGLYFASVLRAISYARVRSAGTTAERTGIRAGVMATVRGMSIRRLLASSHMGDMPEAVWTFNEIFEPKPNFFSKTCVFNEMSQPEIGYVDVTPPIPQLFIIGVSNTVPAGTTSIQSDYYWAYNFGMMTYSNWYYPGNYVSLPPYTSSNLETVGSSDYMEVIEYGGISNPQINYPSEFRLDVYNGTPEIYHSPDFGGTDNSGVIIKFSSNVTPNTFALPSDLYTISGTTVTWNTSHPLYPILSGKEAYPVQ
jgi:phage tail P2-like protein